MSSQVSRPEAGTLLSERAVSGSPRHRGERLRVVTGALARRADERGVARAAA